MKKRTANNEKTNRRKTLFFSHFISFEIAQLQKVFNEQASFLCCEKETAIKAMQTLNSLDFKRRCTQLCATKVQSILWLQYL